MSRVPMPRPSLATLRTLALGAAIAGAACLAVAPAAASAQVELPPDTYGDVHVRALVERAREARAAGALGLESYDGTLWERLYVGLTVARFRRERALFHQERVARIRWNRDGNHFVRWEGARQDIPIAGLSSTDEEPGPVRVEISPSGRPDPDDEDRPEGAGEAPGGGEGDEAPRGLAAALARSLAGGAGIPAPLRHDPGSDHIHFGIGLSDGDAEIGPLHPLADTAGLHYRYRSGDTVRVALAGDGRTVTLAEVRVEPRRPAFELLAASLWFDEATGTLVRTTYRPSRAFNLEVDAPDEAGDVPRLLRPIEFEIRYVTVDHGLFDFRWWIPRRFAFEGELRVGAFLRLPASLEWTVSGLEVNAAHDSLVFPAEPPPGWTLGRPGEDGDDEEGAAELGPRVTILVPPASELGDHPLLSPPRHRGASAFGAVELRELESRIRGLAPAGALARPHFAWGLQEGLTRYNRVEGLSTGIALTLPVAGAARLRGEGRLGLADREPNGELSVARGDAGRELRVAAYRRLASASEWAPGHSLAQSIATVLWGGDRDVFYRTAGGELTLRLDGDRSLREGRLFAEGHRSAERSTHWHLRRVFSGDTLAPNPAADRGHWFGASLRHRWQTGVDPARERLFTELRLEGASGSSEYVRGWAGVGVAVPLDRRVTVGLEAAGGASGGSPPAQRHFFPGGPRGFRGGATDERQGEAFWLARAELAGGPPFARVILFGDLVHTGPAEAIFHSGRPDAAVGIGASVLDGLLRIDVTRGVRGADRWRVWAYLDGIL